MTNHVARFSTTLRSGPLRPPDALPAAGRGRTAAAGASRALLCGCGALGSAIANTLVRAGVGTLRIVDRDFVELSNLQRQTLFDEADAAAGLPKAVAAAEKLRRINSAVTIEPIVADIEPANIERFCEGVDVILDGTDNFETRFLINDAAVKLGLPWVYGGCVGAEGQTMTILPGETPCLRCLMPECPPPGSTPTCESAGILGPIVGVDRLDRGRRGDQNPQRQPRRRFPQPDGRRSLAQLHSPDSTSAGCAIRWIARRASTASSPGFPAARAAARPCSAAATPCN